MKKILFLSLLIFFLSSFLPVFAQQKNDVVERYFKGTVQEVVKEGKKGEMGVATEYQILKVHLDNGTEKGKVITLENSHITKATSYQKLSKGEKILVLKTEFSSGKSTYTFMDRYRLNIVIFIIAGFFLLVILTAGKKGIGSILGLLFSIGVIFYFIVPRILQGQDPLVISIIGSLIILTVTMYLAHGFSKKISVAVVATFLSLLISGLLAVLFVYLARLSGLGSEESGFMVQLGSENINFQGLLLGGIIIGALGVLDDVTTTQAATVFEFSQVAKSSSFKELFLKGFSVGKEHITSVVNTLVLAYAGASLSLFLLFVLNPAHQPYWVIFNNQSIVEEIVRTISGSVGLVLAVPVTTALSAFVFAKKNE